MGRKFLRCLTSLIPIFRMMNQNFQCKMLQIRIIQQILFPFFLCKCFRKTKRQINQNPNRSSGFLQIFNCCFKRHTKVLFFDFI